MITKILKSAALSLLCLLIWQCAGKNASETSKTAAPLLPKDIFGVSVGMEKEDAEKKLKEIAKLIRLEGKNQEVWAIKDDPRFSHLAVGYNGENEVRYVTAYTKLTDGAPIKPDQIGDLSKAQSEAVGPNYTYVWQVPDAPAAADKDAYKVTVRGTQPETFSFYTLSAAFDRDSEEEEEREREAKERGGDAAEKKDGDTREEREREEEREEKERGAKEEKNREKSMRDTDRNESKNSGK